VPPYSRLTEFLVGKYREIADDPKASLRQRLEALKNLKELRPARHLGRKLKHRTNKLLGISGPVVPAPAGDSPVNLLGQVDLEAGVIETSTGAEAVAAQTPAVYMPTDLPTFSELVKEHTGVTIQPGEMLVKESLGQARIIPDEVQPGENNRE
jgi:hypothetical protein